MEHSQKRNQNIPYLEMIISDTAKILNVQYYFESLSSVYSKNLHEMLKKYSVYDKFYWYIQCNIHWYKDV